MREIGYHIVDIAKFVAANEFRPNHELFQIEKGLIAKVMTETIEDKTRLLKSINLLETELKKCQHFIKITSSGLITSLDENGNEYYTTKDGLIRYFHNPSEYRISLNGNQGIDYSLGATQSPFFSENEIFQKTSTPAHLGETDFFTNYINATGASDKIYIDPRTGNRYYQNHNSELSSIPFQNEKHWNIQRFLISPHLSKPANSNLSQGRLNILYDIFKYFLYQEKGNREIAKKAAQKFMKTYVDPIIFGKAQKWLKENLHEFTSRTNPFPKRRFIDKQNLFASDTDDKYFVYKLLGENSKVAQGLKKGKVFSKKEVKQFLIDYNLEIRRKSKKEARAIAENIISQTEDQISRELNDYEQTAKKNEEKTDDGVPEHLIKEIEFLKKSKFSEEIE